MIDRLKQSLQDSAYNWGVAMELRALANTYLPEYGSIEEAMLTCMFYLWALERLDDQP